jgi:hypothetical protein
MQEGCPLLESHCLNWNEMLMAVVGMWDQLYLSEDNQNETIDVLVVLGIEKRISPALLVVGVIDEEEGEGEKKKEERRNYVVLSKKK